MHELAAWLALAYRCPMATSERIRIALGSGPDPGAFPSETLAHESEDLSRLEDLGVRVLTIRDQAYPSRLRGETAPIVLQVAGRTSLLESEGVTVLGGYRGAAGQALMENLDAGGRAVVVLSKGMLKAKTILRTLHEPIEEGSVVLVSAEPPRACWGPIRDRRRDALVAALSRR